MTPRCTVGSETCRASASAAMCAPSHRHDSPGTPQIGVWQTAARWGRLDVHLSRKASMLSLVYTSAARTPFSDGDLATLLMNSRANNRRLGLSGFLMHKQGRFVQVLEGPDDAVQQRYAIIAADPRHSDLDVLLRESIPERRFAAWTMGYRATTDTLATEIPGYADVAGASLDVARARPDLEPSVHSLLDWFRAPAPAGA